MVLKVLSNVLAQTTSRSLDMHMNAMLESQTTFEQRLQI